MAGLDVYDEKGKSISRIDSLDSDASSQHYAGTGTVDDPYVIEFLQNDPQDPLSFSKSRKWTIALSQALPFFAVTFASSVYAPSIPQVAEHFHVPVEVAILGLALYVLGFAMGPMFWAPVAETKGRRFTFVVSYTIFVAFTAVAPLAPNITALLLLRFFASAFGSSAQTNAGAIVSDVFSQEERGPVMAIFAACPFLGPAFGPIVGGYVAETKGWRWVLGVNAIVCGVAWITAMLVIVETYAPVIQRTRAAALSRKTGKAYVSKFDRAGPPRTLPKVLSIALTRPWIFIFREPIVLLTGLYVSVIYATLYMLFAAIPIIFERTRGWGPGVGGLPFAAVAIGVFCAILVLGAVNKIYLRRSDAAKAAGRAIEPENRLLSAMIGSVVLPIGLFLFAWTTYPSVPWIAPIVGIAIFSSGLLMVFVPLITYLIDCYTIYAASAIAANTIMRCLFATAFPLFTPKMYNRLGNQWASCIPAFLTVACLPFPFLFYKYGQRIRAKCKYAAEAAKLHEMVRARAVVVGGDA